jgi:hypothetical protein
VNPYGNLGDAPARVSRAQHEFRLECVTIVFGSELETFRQGVAAQAALSVIELSAAEQRKEKIRKAVREAIGLGGAVPNEVADSEHQCFSGIDREGESHGFLGWMLAVGVHGDGGTGSALARAFEARARRASSEVPSVDPSSTAITAVCPPGRRGQARTSADTTAPTVPAAS